MSQTTFQKIILWGVCAVLISPGFATLTDHLSDLDSDGFLKNPPPGLSDRSATQRLGSLKAFLSPGPQSLGQGTFHELCKEWQTLLKAQTRTLIHEAYKTFVIPKSCSFQRRQSLKEKLASNLGAIQKSYFAATPWDDDTSWQTETPELLALYFSVASEEQRSTVLTSKWGDSFQDALLKSARSAYLFGVPEGLAEHQSLTRVQNVLHVFRLETYRAPEFAWPYALKALSLVERQAKEGRNSDPDYMITAMLDLINHRINFYAQPQNSETSNFFFKLASLTQPTSLAEIFHHRIEGVQIFSDLHTSVVIDGLDNTRTALVNHMNHLASAPEGPIDFAPRLIQNYMTLWNMRLDQGDCSPDILNLLVRDIENYLSLVPPRSLLNADYMTLYFQTLRVFKRLKAEHGVKTVSPRRTLHSQGTDHANSLFRDKKLMELCQFLKRFMEAKLPSTYLPRIDYKKLYTHVTDTFSDGNKIQGNLSESLALLISYRKIFLSPFIDTGQENYANFLHMTLLSLLNDVTNPKDRRAVQIAIYDEMHLLSKVPKLKETFISFRDKVRSIIQGELTLSDDEIHPPLKRYLETPQKPNSAGRQSRKNVRKR